MDKDEFDYCYECEGYVWCESIPALFKKGDFRHV